MTMASEITLSHKADGTPYVRLYLGSNPITGKASRPYREFPGMTDAEAMEAASSWRESLIDGDGRESLRTGTMLTRHVDHLEAHGHSHNTIKTYRLYVRRYAAPIARMPIAEVTPSILDDLFSELLINGPRDGKPLAPNTVKKFREFLKGAFRQEVREGAIEVNPVSNSRTIPAAKSNAQSLDEPDAEALELYLLSVLSGTPTTRMGIMRRNAALGMLLALHTGARVGEVCALRWRDYNPKLGLLCVCGNVVEHGGDAIRQDHTKSKRPRNVSIDATTAKALQDHKSWQESYVPSVGRLTPICSVDGTNMAPSTLSDQYRRYRSMLGLDPRTTFHSLRHTHATMLLQEGVDMRTVSERLGHAQVSTTLETYAHVMPGRDKAAADAFGRLLGGEQ